MIVITKPDADPDSEEFKSLLEYLENKPNIRTNIHREVGTQQTLTEIYLIGDTAALDAAEIESMELVDRVVRISEEYRVLGRHKDDLRPTGFEYNGVTFSQDTLHIFAGLCAVDTPQHVEIMLCRNMDRYVHAWVLINRARAHIHSRDWVGTAYHGYLSSRGNTASR
jgi:3-deoxy-7-phosphoheptulonate synthase